MYEIGRLKIKMKKILTTMEENIDESGNGDSDITSYNSENISVNSHLQFHNKPASLTGTRKFKIDREDSVKIPRVTIPKGVVLQQEFEEWNRKIMFKDIHAKSVKLELRNVILLVNQYIMDLLHNPRMVGNIYKAKKKILLQSNGGNMLITHKA